jgi:toxin YxiD
MKIAMDQELKRSFRAGSALILMLGLVSCGQAPVTQSPSGEQAHTSAVAATSPVTDRYDLERDESRGGHTLSRHVARTDEQLEQRLRKERNISAASTWTSREIAEETVASALHAEQGRVENWIRRGQRRPNLALHFGAGRAIGRSLRRGDSEAVTCTSAVVVLRADGPDGYYVLTTYPEARE